MRPKLQFRQLTLDDLGALEQHFPRPDSITHEERLSIQSATGRSIYGFFKVGKLIAIGQIKRISTDSSITKNNPEICSIYIVPDFRTKGIAKRMVAKLEAILKNENFTEVGLLVDETNVIARNLYSKLGYREVESVSTKNPSHNKRLYCVKKLAPQV